MNWINLAGTKEHGPVTIEIPEEEWGEAFGELAVSLLPQVLTEIQTAVGTARHIITFPPTRDHPVTANADINSMVKISGVRAGCWINLTPDEVEITGPVISVISRQEIADCVSEGLIGELVVLKCALHEIHEINESLRDPKRLKQKLRTEPKTRDSLYSYRPTEITANRQAFTDMFRYLGPEHTDAITKLYLSSPGMPVTDHEIDQPSAQQEFADCNRRWNGKSVNGKNVRLPRGTIVCDVLKQCHERIEIPIEIPAGNGKSRRRYRLGTRSWGQALDLLPYLNLTIVDPLTTFLTILLFYPTITI